MNDTSTLIYDVSHPATRQSPLTQSDRRLGMAAPHPSDGVVPAVSQTLDGRAAGIVLADHLDVIGHYSGGPGVPIFKSGSDFDGTRFGALWIDVAARLGG